MKKYMKYYFLLIFSVVGCKEFITIDPPKNRLVTEAVFKDAAQANAALIGIYSQMVTSGYLTYFIPFATGLAGDEMVNHSTDGEVNAIYQNNLHPLGALTNRFWNNGYSFIYQSNAIIEGCHNSIDLGPEIRLQLEAEARFVRAFWYFYLVNFYGEVPLPLTTDYQANAILSRTPVDDVYRKIISDLEYAVANLKAGYVDASGKDIYHERLRPNKFAATALLSRVCLYAGLWTEAEKFATDVIDQTAIYDTVSLNKVFLKNNREAIWQLENPTNGSNQSTFEARWFVLTQRPLAISNANCSTLSPRLLDAFEEGDMRSVLWIGSITDSVIAPHATYYFPFKYKVIKTTNPTEYTTVLRLAEQYLIRAEARAHMGNMKGALEDLNLIRKRAGLDAVITNDKADFLNILLHERQVELFAEWGHRWLDLKRTGKVDEVMRVVSPIKGGPPWNSAKQLWPIPQKELETNPNLKQNIGYN